MRLHTIFGESNILKGVNLTEIQKGYNLVDFEINRLICSNFQAKLSPTSCERERKLKHHVLKEIEPIMQKIIQQGVFAPADLQNGFSSNINAVSKPVVGKVHYVNNCMAADPKITLPNYKNLGRQFANCFCSSFDLCSMYFAIPINYNCMHTQDQILVFRASLQNAKASQGP